MGRKILTGTKWELRFLKLAKEVASWSKDPSTVVGCVITRPDNTIVSLGYNGFPRGHSDAPELYADREYKYEHIIHAELNAIMNAQGNGFHNFTNCNIYVWPFMTCSSCAKIISSYGFDKVIAPYNDVERWQESFRKAEKIYLDIGIKFKYIKLLET